MVKNQQKIVLPKKYKALLAIVVILVLCLLLPCSELYWVLVCVWLSCYWLYLDVPYLVVLGILYLIVPSCTWLSFPWLYLVVLCCQVLCPTVPGSLEPGGQTSPTLPSRGRDRRCLPFCLELKRLEYINVSWRSSYFVLLLLLWCIDLTQQLWKEIANVWYKKD